MTANLLPGVYNNIGAVFETKNFIIELIIYSLFMVEIELNELQKRIRQCGACPFSRSFQGESIPSHNISSHWCWWFRNKFPCDEEKYFTFFKYTGSSDIVFVGLRPSTEWVPDTADFFLANALKFSGLIKERFDFEGNTLIFYESKALITDFIKCRGRARERIAEVHDSCLEFLREEFDIVRRFSGEDPKIIAIGRDTRRMLWKYRDRLGVKWKSIHNIPWIWLHNYATWQGKQTKKYDAFQEYAKCVKSAIAAVYQQ